MTALPDSIIQNGLFCCWKYEERNGRKTKVPYQPETGLGAKSNDPSSFAPYKTAVQASGYDGIGIGIFNGICAIDLDNCVSDSGYYTQTAAEIVALMHSYTEYSPSGNGLHILFSAKGFQYDTKRFYIMNHQAGIEVYVAGATNKYVTVTGNRCEDYEYGDRTQELQVLLDKFMRRPEPAAENAINAKNSDLSMEQLLQLAKGSKNTTFKLKKGEDFSINLYLASEKYYVGTEQWGLTYKELFIAGNDGKGLKLGTDFTYSYDGYGKPIVLSIPNVTKDLNITFTACYHETHDYNAENDVVKENATCAKEGEVLHTCYKCGKVVSEKISVAPNNHTDLKHIDAVAATKTAEGNIEYWYCADCGKYYKDAKATQEITKEQTVTAKLPSDNNTSAGGSTGNNNKPSSNATALPQTGGSTGNNNKPSSNATTSPQTGDNSNLTLWIALLLASGGAVTATTVYGRKKKRSVK